MGWRGLSVIVVVVVLGVVCGGALGFEVRYDEHQPLSKVMLHNARVLLDDSVSISASPKLLGQKGETAEYVTVSFTRAHGANASDWIGVFSPAKFSSKECLNDLKNGTINKNEPPYLCSAPIKFKNADFGSKGYLQNGKSSLTFRLIKQREDFAFGFFSGNYSNPVLLAISNTVTFADLKAPAWPRLAVGKSWNQMTVTWTSGYGLGDAVPVVLWGPESNKFQFTAPATTLTFTRKDMCGPPAKTVGWREPGFFHTGSMTGLWPSTKYYYKIGHRFKDGKFTWGQENSFTSAPAPGQDSLQKVIILGDMGKAERDGSNEYANYQPAALNTTDRLVEDIDNIDLVIHNGDLAYANGYLSEWDQFTEQVENITSRVPYMTSSGNHERDWPGSGSFFQNLDSGGECGVPFEKYFNMPTGNKDKYWYGFDWGQFHFCIADTEHDWREGTEQYNFLDNCLGSVNRQEQPWLIFIAHRVLGYSSGSFYALEGTFAEPESRDQLQQLWQKHKVDLAIYGHVHQYERTCPVYENQCVSTEKDHYSGTFNATIHIVAGGGGSGLAPFTPLNTTWSMVKDFDFGFTKLTSFNSSSLLFEYKRSSNGQVYDKFWIEREYKDVLGCDATGLTTYCPAFLLAH
ncbi:hypothetical protein M758_9G067500 [Ceratodon purpureus]|nr:hypothetical protein M758_9G067500 [Ceratodon purpureus]